MKLSKTIIIVLIVVVILLMIRPLYNCFILKKAFDNAGIVALGKTLNVEINEEGVRDYTFVQNNIELSKWNEKEKNEFMDYMKNNNLTLKPGEYKINQGTKWEKALQIFEFE
ncbi:hypothetical protein [Brassicibacter mesophilus]|uniref:hypothetical protein n=1 Tax=Brassicibacter mesophilus TaxID=745119 RepID=UPI003D191786